MRVLPLRNLCSMVEQVAELQHHQHRFHAVEGLAIYLAICSVSVCVCPVWQQCNLRISVHSKLT